MALAVPAGGLIRPASSACSRTGRRSVQRLHADWPVERSSLARALVSRACRRAFRRTGQSKHAGACRRSGDRLADCSVVHASFPGGLIGRASIACRRCLVGRACSAYRRTGRSSLQRLQRTGRSRSTAAISGGLVGRPCSACRRNGQSTVQRLQADWSVERAVLAGGLVRPTCSACMPNWSVEAVQRLHADWSVERAVLAGGLVG